VELGGVAEYLASMSVVPRLIGRRPTFKDRRRISDTSMWRMLGTTARR
jgi:hypothetical protein